MRSNRKPTRKEQEWRKAVASHGSVLTYRDDVQLHHCVGSTARWNKIDIGEFFLLPLTPSEHHWVHNHLGKMRHEMEKALFLKMCRDMGYPLPDRLMDAILDYRR